MAMLAERRFRKRYNLVPRGKALYEDDSRFGTKMLEKMGWKKGEGLGASSNGSKDFVRIRYKNDAMGLGFEHRDDQWTQHEEHFNGLLQNLNNDVNDETLNNGTECSNDCEDEQPLRVGFGFQDPTKDEAKSKSGKLKEKISGISLEERSKKSKARVHYKKFTKGKDLAQYSEKDLANIFGKKIVDEQQEVNDFYKNLNNAFGIIGEETNEELNSAVNSNEENIEENSSKEKDKKRKKKDNDKEVVDKQDNKTFTSSMSIQDYFKMKMEAFKNKKTVSNNGEDINNPSTEEPKEEIKKKKKKNKKELHDLENDSLQELHGKKSKKNQKKSDEESVNGNESKQEPEQAVARKKKSKKRNIEETSENFILKEIIPEVDDDCLQEPAKKKSKKNKKSLQEIHSFSNIRQDTEIAEIVKDSIIIEKESKKNKSQLEQETLSKTEKQKVVSEVSVLDDSKPNKKSKKSKNTINSELSVVNENSTINKLEVSDSEITKNVDNEIINLTLKTKKKKKKKDKKPREIIEIVDTDEDEPNENQPLTVVCSDSVEKPTKEVSSNDNNKFSENDVDSQAIDLEELKKQLQAFNIYQISTFSAEKFRNISLNDFNGSALPQIEGYGLSPDLQLEIVVKNNDEERITKLWKCVLNKYEQLDKPKKTYKTYVRDAYAAFKKKQKPPKLYVKTWQRKNAFNIV